MTTYYRRLSNNLLLVLFVLLPFFISAQPGTLDASFNPLDNAPAGPYNSVFASVIQPDGKMVIAGNFTSVNGVPRNRIARLESNGDLDPSFNPMGPNGTISAIVLQSDGNFIIAGGFSLIDGSPRSRIARLLQNGSLDTSFDPGTGVNGTIYSLALQSNGKIVAGGSFDTYNGTSRKGILRVNSDGSLDTLFDPGTGVNGAIYSLALQSDGKIIAVGSFTAFQGLEANRIIRLNTDGSRDFSFLVGSGTNNLVLSTVIQSDGKILIGGQFTTYRSESAYLIARLNNDGTRDLSFTASVASAGNTLNPSYIKSVQIQPDSKILIAGHFGGASGIARKNIARLNINGTLDTSFNLQYYEFGATLAEVQQPATLIRPDGKIVLLGGLRLVDSAGKPDNSFIPTIGSGANETVLSIETQSDQKIIISGEFDRYNGVARNYIARLQTDGTLDSSFDPGAGADSAINVTAIQPDGKIIIGGGFKTYDGAGRNRIARVNSDGSLDALFDPGIGANGSVNTITLQPDGKIIIGGNFTTYNGSPRNRIARIYSDGSLDPSFDPGIGASGSILSTSLQSDGKIIVGGDFHSYAAISRNYIARLNTDGSLDISFDVQNGFDYKVLATAIQPDGKILVGGYFFFYYSGKVARKIVRLNTDGMKDLSFNPGGAGAYTVGFPLELLSYPEESYVHAIEVEADGKIVISGRFLHYNTTEAGNLVRLEADGTIDNSFTPGGGPYTKALAIQDDRKIIFGGDFRITNGSNFNTRIARKHSKSAQTITFNSIPTKLNSDPAFSLTATASSGLPVSYMSSNTSVATISGNTVSIIGVGTTTITASQVGDFDFYAATPVDQTLTVTKLDQIITFSALPSKVYGDPSFNLAATASSGLPVSYVSSNTSVATVSGSTINIVGVGSTIITASQAGNFDYYPATSVTQTLTVNKANQTITFPPLPTKTFGDATFSLTATSNSGLPVSYLSSNLSVATISGSTVTIVGAGSTIITASQIGNTNYNPATHVNQTQIVNKANQLITFNVIPSLCPQETTLLTATSNYPSMPITFSSSNSAIGAISSNTLLGVSEGTIMITAFQAGDNNHNPASSIQNAKVHPIPTITISGPSSSCNSTTLSASGGSSYSWSGPGVTNPAQNPQPATQTGTYYVTGYSAAGCTATASKYVTISYPPSISISQTGGNLCSTGYVNLHVNATAGSTYYWYHNGATTATTWVDSYGSKSVLVTWNGCSVTGSYYVPNPNCGSGGGGGGGKGHQYRISSDNSDDITVSELSFQPGVYPNPVDNELNVVLEEPVQVHAEITFTELSGKVLATRSIEKGDNKTTIVTGTIPDGIYILAILSDSRKKYLKVIVRHGQ